MREFTASDFDDLLRLDSDPRVLKYINGGKPMSRAEVQAAARRVTGYYALYPGLGVWRASRRDNEAFVGWYCLKYCPPTTDVEVGYRFSRFTLAIGAQNVFDTFPDRNLEPNSNLGIFTYPSSSPFGMNGRFVYTRASVRF